MEQKYKTIDDKTLTSTPHTAWVQTFGKQPRLLRNSDAAFVPNPLIYGPRRPSRLSDYVGYKSARRSRPSLRFLDIENPTAPRHPMFRQDETTGLPKKLTRKEKTLGQGKKDSSTKRKARTTLKRTGGRPTRKLQTSGMSLQTEIPAGTSNTDNTIPQPATSDNDDHDDDDQSSASSEDTAPSPKRQNKKRTPPANATESLRESTRNRQSALSHAFGNPVPINAINNKHFEKKKGAIQFQIDSPPDKRDTENYPSLKSLIQEMGFTEKTPQYRACVKLIEAISPKNKTSHTEVVDLTSPIEDDATADKNNEISFINTKILQESGTD